MIDIAKKIDTLLARPLVAVVVGFLLAIAVFVLQDAYDTCTKRKAIAEILAVELTAIPKSIPEYESNRAFYRDPIYIPSAPLLLDGQLLNYSKHKALVTALLHLQVALSKHNEFVSMTNNAQTDKSIPLSVYESWYVTIKQLHAAVVESKAEVITALHEAKLGTT